jgi:hypothetical protein
MGEYTLGVEADDWDDEFYINPLTERCDALLPALTAALPDLRWVRLGGVVLLKGWSAVLCAYLSRAECAHGGQH